MGGLCLSSHKFIRDLEKMEVRKELEEWDYPLQKDRYNLASAC